MAHDAEFWKTAGETGAGIVTFLAPIAGAAWLAVKKFRKDHPDEPQDDPKALPRPSPCADVEHANDNLRREVARLEAALAIANALAQSRFEEVVELQEESMERQTQRHELRSIVRAALFRLRDAGQPYQDLSDRAAATETKPK